MLDTLERLVFHARQWKHRLSAPRKMTAYMRAHDIRKLNVGAGPNLLEGWLNTTLRPFTAGSVHLNATKPWPLPEASFDYVSSEHMIEHVTFRDGQAMLGECFRVLKKGGRIRLSTPDLERMLALYTPRPNPEQDAYIRWTVDHFLADTDGYNPAFVINQAFHGWGHAFLYDFASLKHALELAGFVDVQRFRPGESRDPALRNVEQHGKVIENERMNQYESLVVEARKP